MKQFPIVKASGSNYEVGVAIGKTMREKVKKVLANSQAIFKEDFQIRIQQSKSYQQETLKHFPQYMEELHGIAKGAGVSFDELFLSNNREVADFNPFVLDPNHCTIVGIPNKDGYLLGHNEDWDASSLPLLYLLDATINGTRIFGLNYANNIIGDSIALNGYGLAQAVNELFHQDAKLGVPKNFVARAILDCKTLEEAEEIMRTIPRAAGFNHVLVQEKRLWNIESSAKEHAIEKIEDEAYVHTNHYLTQLKRIDKGNEESRVRYTKVKKLLAGINSVGDMKRVLSDQSDPPVCRAGTIGSVIIDTGRKIAHIAYGQPTQEGYTEYSITHVVQ